LTCGDRKIGQGAEPSVYLRLDGLQVIKTNDAIMHGSWFEFFNRLALHNWIFPETAYELVGFTEIDKNALAAIVSQQYLFGDKGAIREEVESDMLLRGFRRTRNDDYYHSELGIIIEDLHDENVLRTAIPGLLLYFDPILYPETPDMKLNGPNQYRFPF
jgi:hypothetical protein